MYLLKKIRKKAISVTVVSLVFFCLIAFGYIENANSLTHTYAQTNNKPIKTYKYAYATPSCSPRGTVAVRIYLSDEQKDQLNREKPRIYISIYEDISNISQKTYKLGQDSNLGEVAFCPPIGDCFLAKSGTVVINSVLPDKSIIGECHLDFRGGFIEVGAFQASWQHSKTPCLQVK